MEELRRWVEAMKQLISQKTFVLPAPKSMSGVMARNTMRTYTYTHILPC